MSKPADKAILKAVTGCVRVGYLYVSEKDGHLEFEREALARAGCIKVYEDYGSGVFGDNRVELRNLVSALNEGDTLIVWKLDHLGRSMSDLIKLMLLLINKRVVFKSLSDKIGVNSADGRKFFRFIRIIAQYRESKKNIKFKKSGRLTGQHARVGSGRPAKLDAEAIAEIRFLKHSAKLSMDDIAGRYGVCRQTLYNAIARAEKNAIEI